MLLAPVNSILLLFIRTFINGTYLAPGAWEYTVLYWYCLDPSRASIFRAGEWYRNGAMVTTGPLPRNRGALILSCSHSRMHICHLA